jgi:alpha-L-rhamnosidase
MALYVSELRTNARTLPLGIDTKQPEFAWKLVTTGQNVVQTSYAIQVAYSEQFDGGLIWDSGRVESPAQFGVVYSGQPLESGRRYFWRVRVWATGEDDPGTWSEPAWFETGILDPALWRARWISGPAPKDKRDYRALYLRGTADLPAPVVRGRAYVSALGWYRFFVNGTDLTGPALVPRWTPFEHYVEYQVYDVSEAFREGWNVLAMAVGDGRFRGALGIGNHQATYGNRLAGFMQVELQLADGSTLTLFTDTGWYAGSGRIVASDPKLGERVDLRISDDDWLTGEILPERFAPVDVLEDQGLLIAEETEPVREIDRLPARSVTRTPSGKQIVDFGQNFAGVARLKLRGPAGTTVRLTPSEVLTSSGELDTDYIQTAGFGRWHQYDEVVCDGNEHWWQPWFTIHGFRYIEIDGLPGDLDLSDVEGVVLSSDLPLAGSFACSDPRLNQLHRNVFWSLRSNFTDTPTDCPTRERAGWTGDIQVFAPTATLFVDIQAYLRRYLRNLAAEQLPSGRVPIFIPKESRSPSGWQLAALQVMAASVGWGDAAVLLPWTLHRYYGDRDVLEWQYPSMKAWVDQLARRAHDKRSLRRRLRHTFRSDIDPYLLDTGFLFGEWLRPGADALKSFLDAQRHGSVVATAYFAHSCRLLAAIATELGRPEDARRYCDLSDKVRAAWRTVFRDPDGRIGTDRQDDYVRALAFDLLEPEERPAAVDRLVTLIEQAGDHLATGFLSTPMLLPVLVNGGRADVAWRLLLQTTNPSWLYQVGRGATTVWETWEGYKEDGTAKASHNHYAFGAIANFLTEYIAGLAPAEPGYQVLNVRPLVGGGLTWARASVQTPYGTAASSWRLDGDQVELEVVVPPGTRAEIHLGEGRIERVGSGTHRFSWEHHTAAGTAATTFA